MERHSSDGGGFNVFANLAGTELPLFPYEHFEDVARTEGVNNVVVSYLMPEGYKYRIRNSWFLKK